MPRKSRRDPQSVQRISAERNLESWSLWQPADSRAEPKARILVREVEGPNGVIRTATVELRFDPVLGALTTEDEKVFYGLIRMWEEDGRPDELTFSLRRLAQVLKRSWGKRQRQDLKLSLRRLIAVPMTWTNAFRDGAKKRVFRSLSEFHILSALYIAETEDEDEHFTTEKCRLRFHETVLKNLRAFYTKPVLFDTIIGLKSGIAQLVYRYADPMLTGHDRHVRRTADLFADLGLDAARYNKRANRRTALERAFREINGAPLSEGGVLRCSIEEAKGGDDLLAVFAKTKQLASPPPHAATPKTPRTQASAPPRREATARAETRDPRPDPAADLVWYFHGLFHSLAPETYRPRPRELSQARKLIEEQGSDAARAVVEYALREARKTGFDPATFGGILQYVDRALADLRGRATKPEAAPVACDLCDGRGAVRVRWPDGRADVMPCTHDPEWVRARMAERGLTPLGAAD